MVVELDRVYKFHRSHLSTAIAELEHMIKTGKEELNAGNIERRSSKDILAFSRNELYKLNWDKLWSLGLNKNIKPEKVIDLIRVNPRNALTELRSVVSWIAKALLKSQHLPTTGTLEIKIDRLKELLPPVIFRNFHHIRHLGNIGAHPENQKNPTETKPEDAATVLPIFVNVTNWYIEYNRDHI